MERLQIRRPDDFHVHLREGALCSGYARDATNAGWSRLLVMPNTIPPITDAQGLKSYKRSIEAASQGLTALMTFQIRAELTKENLSALQNAGAVAGKLYPDGATTNSDTGIHSLKDIYPVLSAMEELGLVLSIHGEDPSAPVLEREARFIKHFNSLRKDFPKLKMILEHVSSKKGIDAVRAGGANTAGTLTLHHLLYTLDDLAGNLFNPHLYCKPILKSPLDRQAIQEAALGGEPCFFFGSDSAPHPRENKESSQVKAGIYTMPVSLSMLAEFFEKNEALNKLEAFISEFGAKFYGVPLNKGTITLEKEPWIVSKLYHNTVPLKAGETLLWRLSPK